MISTNTQIANLSLFHASYFVATPAIGKRSRRLVGTCLPRVQYSPLPVSCTAARCLRLRLPRCVHATCVIHRAVTNELDKAEFLKPIRHIWSPWPEL